MLAVPMLAFALAAPELAVVPEVDLERYAGKWFEIARLPNRFERSCASDVTATYALRDDGKIDVRNACRKADGSMKEANGTAKLRDAGGPASKLKVTFFWPFYGDYWIVRLDPEYNWALVGSPDRDYLWILSRTPSLTEAVYSDIVRSAAEKGFETSRLIRTKQTQSQ